MSPQEASGSRLAKPPSCAAGRVLAAFVLAVIVLASGCGGSQAQVGRSFDARRAWQMIEAQVEVGQRPAGSPRLRRLAARLRAVLPRGRFEAIPGHPGLRNVVGSLPGEHPAIVVGAHYDTLARPDGFVGANNGAAGTAIVVEAARALRRIGGGGRRREVRFALFDGEEPPAALPEETSDFYHSGLRGSRAYVAKHRGEVRAMILLDYVAGRRVLLPHEASSSEALWDRLLEAADAVGARRYFSSDTGPRIVDDHTPFLRAQVPAVDLIDWRYPGHSLADGLSLLSLRSVDAVGETVVRLVEELSQ